MHITSKLPETPVTIFTVMSQLAAQHNAVNLGQGFPDFSMSEDLMRLVYESMLQQHNQYAHTNGVPVLREMIAQKVAALYNNTINPNDEITITPGGTYAIYTALTTILNHGDEVIIIEPCYDSYIPNIIINKAIPVTVQMTFPGYAIPWGEVRSKITNRTKAIIINSPHNPTGQVLTGNDIAELQATVAGTNIFIISDEVYEHIIFDDQQHLSILRYPELYKRSFVCFSFGKTYNCTGWKMGYCIAPPSLSHEFRKVHQFNAFSCNTPVQFGLAAFMQNKDAYLQLGTMLQQKRDMFRSLMRNTGFTLIPSNGSYFECYSYEKINNLGDKDFAMQLVAQHGVAAIPMSSFYNSAKDDNVLRFCFAKNETTLNTAAQRLHNM